MQELKNNDKSLEKLTLFISNYNKKCVISTYDNNTDSGKLGKQFIGFEYSTRKGHEGLHPYPDNATGKVVSQLYTDENVFDNKKVNYYFYKAFLGEFPEVHENLKDNVKYADINDLFNFEKKEFDYAMNTKMRPRQSREAEKGLRLKDICEFLGKGKRPASFANNEGSIDFIVSSLEKEKCLTADYSGEYLVIGDGGKPNIHYLKGEFSASDHTYILQKKDNNIILKYIYVYIVNNLYILEQGFTGISIQNISKTYLENLYLPLPPLQTQQQIVEKFDEIKKKTGGKQEKNNFK